MIITKDSSIKQGEYITVDQTCVSANVNSVDTNNSITDTVSNFVSSVTSDEGLIPHPELTVENTLTNLALTLATNIQTNFEQESVVSAGTTQTVDIYAGGNIVMGGAINQGAYVSSVNDSTQKSDNVVSARNDLENYIDEHTTNEQSSSGIPPSSLVIVGIAAVAVGIGAIYVYSKQPAPPIPIPL